jgi:hypothetical protein
MMDYQESIEKLRTDAARAARVRDQTRDPLKHDLFSQMHDHLDRPANELERAMRDGVLPQVTRPNPSRWTRFRTVALNAWNRRARWLFPVPHR